MYGFSNCVVFDTSAEHQHPETLFSVVRFPVWIVSSTLMESDIIRPMITMAIGLF